MQEVRSVFPFYLVILFAARDIALQCLRCLYERMSVLLYKLGILFRLSQDQKSVAQNPYRMLTLSIPLHIECVVYFLIDYSVSRPLWDPLFVRAEEIEFLDRNNRVFHLFYKPIDVITFPWSSSTPEVICSTIRSRMRDFCVHLHYNFDSDSNTYYVMLSSVHHASCKQQAAIVRGEMRLFYLLALCTEIGYRIEAVNSEVTRISAIWSISPGGNLSSFSYFSNLYADQMMSALPGLRDMLSQLPDYHIFNLLEQIAKKVTANAIRPSKSLSSIQDSSIQSSSSDESLSDSIHVGLPSISNTVPHVSRCSSLVVVITASYL